MPISLSSLADKEGHKKCITNNHFLNYWQQDGEIVYRVGDKVQRTEQQKVRHYILSRASTFFTAFANNEEMVAQHIDGAHFVTEVLLRLWKAFNPEDPQALPAALKSVFANAQEATDYEGVMQGLFEGVSQEYVELKDFYQRAAKANDRLAQVMQVQGENSAKFSSPLLSFQVFEERVASLEDTGEPAVEVPFEPIDEEEEGQPQRPRERSILKGYVQRIQKLEALRCLPSLASFYALLTQTFSGRLTKEETLSLTVPAAIKHISGYEDEATVFKLQDNWEKFKKDWGDTRGILLELAGQCNDQQVNRGFEQIIPDLTDESLIASIVRLVLLPLTLFW